MIRLLRVRWHQVRDSQICKFEEWRGWEYFGFQLIFFG